MGEKHKREGSGEGGMEEDKVSIHNLQFRKHLVSNQTALYLVLLRRSVTP